MKGEHTHACLFHILSWKRHACSPQVAHFVKKSIKLVLNYHRRPSSQKNNYYNYDFLKLLWAFTDFWGNWCKRVGYPVLNCDIVFGPWWIVCDICRNKVRFNNLIQMYLSTYSVVLFNVEYQVRGFCCISICPVGMILKGET